LKQVHSLTINEAEMYFDTYEILLKHIENKGVEETKQSEPREVDV